MENEKLPATQMQKLMPSLVIREQPDKDAMVKQIAKMLGQLAKLYQVPNFDGENAVLLAYWIVEEYQYEPLQIVLDCLVKPPSTGDKNWRLTPDTIEQWLTIKLEEQANKREKEYQKEKQRLKEAESSMPPNFPDFDKLLAGTWFEQAKREENFDQEQYNKVKNDYLNSRTNGENN